MYVNEKKKNARKKEKWAGRTWGWGEREDWNHYMLEAEREKKVIIKM